MEVQEIMYSFGDVQIACTETSKLVAEYVTEYSLTMVKPCAPPFNTSKAFVCLLLLSYEAFTPFATMDVHALQ